MVRTKKLPATARATHRTAKTHGVAHVRARDISRLAYSLFQARGSEHGHDVEDWFVAEAELITGKHIENRLDLRQNSVTARMNSPEQPGAPRSFSEGPPDADLVRRALAGRIRGEFEEMPGLRLTPVQASKLFGISPEVCAAILAHLIEEGFLRLSSDGSYARRWHHT